jgi:hypothetical protein
MPNFVTKFRTLNDVVKKRYLKATLQTLIKECLKHKRLTINVIIKRFGYKKV